jgi:hypothetical protein
MYMVDDRIEVLFQLSNPGGRIDDNRYKVLYGFVSEACDTFHNFAGSVCSRQE